MGHLWGRKPTACPAGQHTGLGPVPATAECRGRQVPPRAGTDRALTANPAPPAAAAAHRVGESCSTLLPQPGQERDTLLFRDPQLYHGRKTTLDLRAEHFSAVLCEWLTGAPGASEEEGRATGIHSSFQSVTSKDRVCFSVSQDTLQYKYNPRGQGRRARLSNWHPHGQRWLPTPSGKLRLQLTQRHELFSPF